MHSTSFLIPRMASSYARRNDQSSTTSPGISSMQNVCTPSWYPYPRTMSAGGLAGVVTRNCISFSPCFFVHTIKDRRLMPILKHKPPFRAVCAFENSVLATSYSRLATKIASTGLNCRVRNENGGDPSDKSPEQNLQFSKHPESGPERIRPK